MNYELWLGMRYLFANRREHFISVSTAFSISGVALGVGALIVILSVMSGFREDFKDKLIGINAHLIVDAPGGIRDAGELMRVLSAMEHVVGVSPFVTGQGLLQLPDRSLGVLIRGVDVTREPRVSRLADYVVMGTFPVHEDDVMIGTELSAFHRAGIGDQLQVVSPLDGKTHDLTVSGIFRSGMYETDAFFIAVTLARAQRMYHLEEVVHGISVKLDQLERSTEMQHAIQRRLGTTHTVRTWMDLNPALFGALRVEKIVMFVIATLIILVAALNIMSMLTMIVMEKTKEIGILRALGATRFSVARLFFYQGCIVGLLGIGLGFIGGIALTLNLNNIVKWAEATFGVALFPPTVYYLDYLPTQINSSDVTWVLTAAFGLVILAGTYAAIRVARLVPVEALRYE